MFVVILSKAKDLQFPSSQTRVIPTGAALPRSEGNSHLRNQRKTVPFHTHEFVTLKIDTNTVTD
jgi:hypothetical protein